MQFSRQTDQNLDKSPVKLVCKPNKCAFFCVLISRPTSSNQQKIFLAYQFTNRNTCFPSSSQSKVQLRWHLSGQSEPICGQLNQTEHGYANAYNTTHMVTKKTSRKLRQIYSRHGRSFFFSLGYAKNLIYFEYVNIKKLYAITRFELRALRTK